MKEQPTLPTAISARSLPIEIDVATGEVLLGYLEPVDAPSGTSFLRQGSPNDRLWFLIKGTASIERTWQGKTLPVANLTAPGIFGATTFFQPTNATVTIQATSDSTLLTLSHPAHERLRTENPRAAEALALATVRVLAERFDLLDQRMTEFFNTQVSDQVRENEWAKFRTRLFEKPNII